MIDTGIAIRAEHLRVKRSKKIVLSDLSLMVRKGAITGLVGPSGSGKTTLIRSIVGVQKIAGGVLTVLGEEAGSANLRRRIGYVTQSPAVYEDLTLLQNLQYFATLSQAPPQQVIDIIETVQLGAQRHQIVSSMSGGQRARASLAVALLGDPELLVLDEPTVGLDPLLRRDLWELFGELASQGKTLLVSSHVMDEAERCHNLLLLRDGRLLWNDSRSKLLQHTGTSTVGDAFIAMITEEPR